MILSDREIESALESGLITIDPRPESHRWTSTAIDLTLDAVLLRWKTPDDAEALRPSDPHFDISAILKDERFTEILTIDANGFPLDPWKFVLGFTRQKIHLPYKSRIAARVEGKSSLARMGVGVHVTAPTIHAGFGYNPRHPEGASQPGLPIQLEIFNLGGRTVILDVGMPICQLVLEEVREVPTKGYTGRFSNQGGFTETRPDGD